MFNSIKTNKLLRDTGFPSLKVIKNLELLCLYFLIFCSRQQIILRYFIAGLGISEFGSDILKSFLHSILQYLKIVTCMLPAVVRTQTFLLLIFIAKLGAHFHQPVNITAS